MKRPKSILNLEGVKKTSKKKKRSVKFAQAIVKHRIPLLEGERAIVVSKFASRTATREEVREMEDELDSFKEKMPVHEESRGNTVLFRHENLEALHEARLLQIQHYKQRNLPKSDEDATDEEDPFSDLGPAPDLGDLQRFFEE